jgi:hypothetical protein
MIKLEDVFGVISKPILSYVERADIDTRFQEAVKSGKQIVVYGSSKQGKTALVTKYLPYGKNLLVSLTPKTQLTDIYKQILSSAGVRIVSGATEKRTAEIGIGVGTKVKAMIPFLGSGEVEGKGDLKKSSGQETRYDEILVNLELPQSIAELLQTVHCNKFVILENFHYLNDEVQRQFAFDLRAFQELGVLFVILGVWREKNRMAQFNGDLLDRVIEIPVEPWLEKDFLLVAAKGCDQLNIDVHSPLIKGAIDASFSSIGVFQELMKGICIEAGVMFYERHKKSISDPKFLQSAIETKTQDYSARHQRALEAISAGHAAGGAKNDLAPLYLPYYLVRVILEHGFAGIKDGMQRTFMHEEIKKNHHRGDDVRSSDITNLLSGLANLQSVKSISPPIIDYDQQNRTLQVVDSTFYFFIKHVNAKEVFESIPNPLN